MIIAEQSFPRQKFVRRNELMQLAIRMAAGTPREQQPGDVVRLDRIAAPRSRIIPTPPVKEDDRKP